jgi:hypothetical protein
MTLQLRAHKKMTTHLKAGRTYIPVYKLETYSKKKRETLPINTISSPPAWLLPY